ncbi:helix-turn-helix transcriptional regulator [Bacillus smithii]|uniref:helix-turn-helix transcriptional regulator n=1 Tax=Bacillus smithii TaxID=1479 RepID=UPI003D1B9423
MFQNKIAYWAEQKGIKYSYLAKKCGVSNQTLSRWVTNKTQPDLEKAFLLAHALGVSVDQLGEFKEGGKK